MSEIASLYPWILPVEIQPTRTMREIVEDVAQRYGLTVEELKSQSAAHRIAHRRQEAMWLMRQQLRPDGTQRYSFPQIGTFLGGRDHTTAMYGYRQHERRLAEKQGEAA